MTATPNQALQRTPPMKPSIPHLFPHTKRDWIHLWFSVLLTLTVAMIVKESPIADRSGGRESFHWSYDLTLALAALSLLVVSSRIRQSSWLLAIIGCIAAIIAFGWLGRPVY
jgi:hypothetical protein